MLLIGWQGKQSAPLGHVDLANKGFAVVRALGNRTHTYAKVGKPISIWPGDKLEVPDGGKVKGGYDGHVLLLFGPLEWPAPEKGIFGRDSLEANERYLGRTIVGRPSIANHRIRHRILGRGEMSTAPQPHALPHPHAQLGQIDLASGAFSALRAVSNRTDVNSNVGKRFPIWPGDKLEIPAGCAVKGIYDRHILLLQGPIEWMAPQPFLFGRDLPVASKRLLGRTAMGPPSGQQPRLPSHFNLLAAGLHPTSDFYIDGTGTLRFAWLAPATVKSVAVSVVVGDQTIGPFSYPAHPDSSPDPRVGWFEDSALGTQLRRDFQQESSKTVITFIFRPNVGPEVKANGFLVSRETARNLDNLTAALTNDLAAPNPSKATAWYESWNSLLLETEEAEPSANAFWTIKVWSRLPAQASAKAAMEELFAEVGLSFE